MPAPTSQQTSEEHPWAQTVNRWAPLCLLVVEVLAVIGVFVTCLLGWVQWGIATSFSFRGLLTALHEKWIAALLVTLVLFFRTVLQFLSRIEQVQVPYLQLRPAAPHDVAKPKSKRKKPPGSGAIT
jgi:hypothetical protein